MNNVTFLADCVVLPQKDNSLTSEFKISWFDFRLGRVFIYVKISSDWFFRLPRPLVIGSVTIVSLGVCDRRPIGQGVRGCVIVQFWIRVLWLVENSDIQQTNVCLRTYTDVATNREGDGKDQRQWILFPLNSVSREDIPEEKRMFS